MKQLPQRLEKSKYISGQHRQPIWRLRDACNGWQENCLLVSFIYSLNQLVKKYLLSVDYVPRTLQGTWDTIRSRIGIVLTVTDTPV